MEEEEVSTINSRGAQAQVQMEANIHSPLLTSNYAFIYEEYEVSEISCDLFKLWV